MTEKISKTYRVSRSGMILCPLCMTHYIVEDRAVGSTCPFCKQMLKQSSFILISSTSDASRQRFNRGKSASLLAALGISIAFVACESKPLKEHESTSTEPTTDMPKKQGSNKSPVIPKRHELSSEQQEQLKKLKKQQRNSSKDSMIQDELQSIMYGGAPIFDED